MENYSDYSFVIDIDGTLCPIKEEHQSYEELVPYKKIVEKIRDLKSKGAKIVFFTARNMRSYDGNIGRINKYTARTLISWLEKWSIPYDEIIYGKPWPGKKGFYIDDRTVRPNEFVELTFEEMNKISKESRLEELLEYKQDLDVVITMGGGGKRFREVGYNIPKYMIDVKDKTMFEWSLKSLEGYNDIINKYIFIAKNDSDSDVELFIKEKCKKLGIDNYKIILLDYLTDGQATTAMLASKYWNPDHRLLIYNIDTYVESGCMNSRELKGDGFIPCFNSQGDHWSFVKLDDEGKAVEVKEKVRISDNCTLGAYYFKSCQLFMDLYFEFYSNPDNMIRGEKYVAPLYDFLVKKNGEVYISNVPNEKVHVLGTPKELEDFINR
jgi:capsule biosynthesis phosphatase